MDNRNLYGFTLFTLIIISTVLIKFAFFTSKPIVQSPNIYVETATGGRTRCFPKVTKPLEPVKLEQAVLDFKTKTIDVEFDLGKRANFDLSDGANVTLNFFVKDSATRRIATEGVWAVPTVSTSNLMQLKVSGDYVLRGFLKKGNLRSNQSLYVIPVVTSRVDNSKPLAVDFDESQAIPVLIAAAR